MTSIFSRKKHSREDGEVTRRHILETAVRLFAEHGYADTTSKMICREAGVNIAAVNYHFGSRDDLYRAVLDDVHEHIVNVRAMEEIMNFNGTAREKLGMVLDAYIANIYNSQSWHSRIWAHELIAPSALGGLAFLEGTLSKELLISQLCSEITGIPMDDPALHSCVITVMAPYLLMLCVQRDMARTLVPIFHYRGEDMNVYFKGIIFSGLDDFARRWREGEFPTPAPLPEPEQAGNTNSAPAPEKP
ncbi:MAG: TetR/AcrR family transcriptional regulator [Mailhella sp.]|nr:TetR/AcrR family transcriptional regulator [Mailhella sp.]